MAKESLERHQVNDEEFQKRIQFLEQELLLRSKSEQNNNDHIDHTRYERGITEKEEMMVGLQARIVEFTANSLQWKRKLETCNLNLRMLKLQSMHSKWKLTD